MSALHGRLRGQRVCLHPHITRSFRCQLHVRFPRCATQTQSQVFALNNEVGRDTVKVSGPLKALDCRFRLTLRGLSPYSKPQHPSLVDGLCLPASSSPPLLLPRAVAKLELGADPFPEALPKDTLDIPTPLSSQSQWSDLTCAHP